MIKKSILFTALLVPFLILSPLSAEDLLSNVTLPEGVNASDIDLSNATTQLTGQVDALTGEVTSVLSDLNTLKTKLLELPQQLANNLLTQVNDSIENLTKSLTDLQNIDLGNILNSDVLGGLNNITSSLDLDIGNVSDLTSQITGNTDLSSIPGVSDAASALATSSSAASATNTATSGASSASMTADIIKAYTNERKYITALIKEILLTTEKELEAGMLAKGSAENQYNNQAMMMTAQEQTNLLEKQMANYTRMEIQRSEGIILQTKEIIFEVWEKSAEISRSEINEIKTMQQK